VTTRTLLEDVDKYEKEFLLAGGDRFLVLDDDSPYKSVSKITRLLKELNPGLIVFDQLDKVHGYENERDDLRIGRLYEWARDLAKTYCPVISVGQADASGHNSMWIDEAQMANSKTGKPSELDFIIGIGRIDKDGYENMRYIHISKNKLRGDKNTIEGLRHGKFEVLLKSSLSLYEDM
jgi:hypothetical protein